MDEATGLYDYGARYYDPAVARWGQVEPLADAYASDSPYSYVMNMPINAIHPDGNLVIFINGFTPNKNDQGSRSYWGSFANRVEEHFGENPSRSLFVHGGNDFFAASRRSNGYITGAMNADQILDMIVDENGYVTETIKIITHSMGGALGKGFVAAILKAAKRRGVKGVPISLVADFDPFQAGALQANENVFTQEFIHDGLFSPSFTNPGFSISPTGGLANQSQDNENETYNDESESSHSISTFFNDISTLKEGNYQWNGQTWVLQNSAKEKE